MTLEEAIGYIQELCYAVGDTPCGCEACPYCDTVDSDGICEVMKAINNDEVADNNELKLKPCPFCGESKAEIRHPFYSDTYCWVQCCGCYCTTTPFKTQEEATKAWNRRADNAESG